MASSGRDFEQTIKGYNRLMNKFRRLAADNPELSDEPIREFAQEQRATLKSTPYPAKRPAQVYQRTGQLANRYAVVKDQPAQYRIINQARGKSGYYAGYVVGIRQAWMHINRWYQAHKIIQANMGKLVKKLTGIFEKIWSD